MYKEIVIKIEEETYNQIMNGWMPLYKAANLIENVQKGTPLPKGHGRLIDEKEANGLIADGKNGKAYFGTVNKDWEVIDFLKTVSTIIEADKG